MLKNRTVFLLSGFLLLFFLFPLNQVHSASSKRPLLKLGMRGTNVKSLQTDLKKLGFFNVATTGYFGSITKKSVIKFQSKYGLSPDGIVGSQTYSKIDRLLGRTVTAYRGNAVNRSLLIPWFKNAENIFYRGANAKIIDVDTGLSFKVRRTFGYNHADCETLTAKDTEILKKIYNSEWSWTRRAVIVVTNGKKMAASISAMPHAGREDLPGNVWVNNWRSTGYGPGYNLDKIKGNNMEGHIDIHFLNSKTHETDIVDKAHQKMVYKAAQSGY